MSPRHTHSRSHLLAASVVTAVLVATALTAPVAAEAATPVTTGASLQTAIATSGSYELTQDIPQAGFESPLTYTSSGPSVTIDLHGYDLDANGIVVTAGTALTITDTVGGGAVTTNGAGFTPGIQTTGASLTVTGSATVQATGGDHNPGIGGSSNSGKDAGSLAVSGSATVQATAGPSTTNGAAGIGGSATGSGGTVVISGSAHVTATASVISDLTYTSGAGIGGGSGSYGGTVSVSGSAVVEATGGVSAAGIGGGRQQGLGQFTLAGTATVTATPGSKRVADSVAPNAIGDGAGSVATDSLNISGGTWIIPPSAIQRITQATLTNGGTIINHGQLNGPGTIVNDGTIRTIDGVMGVTAVTNHNYSVNMIMTEGSLPDGVSASIPAYAASIASSGETLPTPTRNGYSFVGWRLAADGSGPSVTDATDLTTHGSSTGSAIDVNVYPAWQFIKLPSTTVVVPSSIQLHYGEPGTLAAAVTNGATGPVSFSVDDGSPFAVAPATAASIDLPTNLSVGTHTLTASYSGDDTYLPSSGSAMVEVTAIATTTTVALSTPSAPAGSVVSITPSVSPAAAGSISVSVDGAAVGSTTSGSPLALPSTLGVGSHAVTATYGGDATHGASSATATLEVTAAVRGDTGTPNAATTSKTTPKVTVTGKRFAKHHKPKVTVTLSKLAPGQKATGKISLYVSGHRVKTVPITNKTKLTVTLPRSYSTSISVKARFLGSSSIAAATSRAAKVRAK